MSRVKNFLLLLPHSKTGWLFVLSLTGLSALRVLEAHYVRVGSSFLPHIGLSWVLLLAVAAVLLAPQSRLPLRPARFLAVTVVLLLSAWPLSLWSGRLSEPLSPLEASVHPRSSSAGGSRTVRLDSLRLATRDDLTRHIGRRRRLRLEISGFLLVPRTGTYRLESSCDDHCLVRLDDETVLDSSSDAVVERDLEEGLHPLEIQYVQGIGPASFVLSWDRPAFLELLPLEQFAGADPEQVTPSALRWLAVEIVFFFLAAAAWWLAVWCLWTRFCERARTLAMELWAESEEPRTRGTGEQLESRSRFLPPWSVTIFLLALALRAGYLSLYDPPLLYGHQYNYFDNALRILEHPRPLRFLLTSDDWHSWLVWTVAPLYHLFLTGVFALFGPGLLSFRLIQFLMDAGVAVAVASLGRQVAGPRGVWAGVAYAFFWAAIDMTNWTMTENLHTFLLVLSVAVLAREAQKPDRRRAFWGGFLLGLSALTRAVSSAFLGLAGLWRASVNGFSRVQVKKSLAAAAMVVAGGAVAILPWTARNVWVMGDPVLIEDVSFFNLYNDNLFRDAAGTRAAERLIEGQPTRPERRAMAAELAYEGITSRPDAFLDKVRINFWHFLRPEGLHYLLNVELPRPWWQSAGAILLDDLLLLASLPLFAAFVVGGHPSATRRLIVMWTVYYLFLVVVVFHNEIRYRFVLMPFLFVGAAGGLEALSGRRRIYRAGVGLALGLSLSLACVSPYAAPGWRAVSAALALSPAAEAVERGDLERAEQVVKKASALDPTSARPWFRYGHWLAVARHPEAALRAYQRGGELVPLKLVPLATRPQLLREAGRAEGLDEAVRAAHGASWSVDPWLLLEIAWRELPPPRTDTILVGNEDYGAVRGFLHPRKGGMEERGTEGDAAAPPPGEHRWTRGSAWLRLIPNQTASSYRIRLHMGSPLPSPQSSPEVRVCVNDCENPVTFQLTRDIRPYELVAHVAPREPIVVRLDVPTWSRAGEPASQGVRVDRMSVSPSLPGAPASGTHISSPAQDDHVAQNARNHTGRRRPPPGEPFDPSRKRERHQREQNRDIRGLVGTDTTDQGQVSPKGEHRAEERQVGQRDYVRPGWIDGEILAGHSCQDRDEESTIGHAIGIRRHDRQALPLVSHRHHVPQ